MLEISFKKQAQLFPTAMSTCLRQASLYHCIHIHHLRTYVPLQLHVAAQCSLEAVQGLPLAGQADFLAMHSSLPGATYKHSSTGGIQVDIESN